MAYALCVHYGPPWPLRILYCDNEQPKDDHEPPHTRSAQWNYLLATLEKRDLEIFFVGS